MSAADRYLLAEVLTNVAAGAETNTLEALGLNPKTARQVLGWASNRNVTLRFKSEERCTFDREVKREVVSSTSHVADYGIGKIVDKVVTTVTEYFWQFEVTYELSAFAGTRRTRRWCCKDERDGWS